MSLARENFCEKMEGHSGGNVKEQMLIGETLFEMETPLPVCWKPEEKQFFYQGEEYRRRVRIRVEFVSQLPNLMKTNMKQKG